MKSSHAIILTVLFSMTGILASCGGVDEARIEEIARKVAQEEDLNARQDFLDAFKPEKFGFGGALEKEWSHAQGCRVGNFIFISGQQPYDTNLDDKGMPLTDLETGRNFEQQLETCLQNIQKVLTHYDADMNDVVMLQGFVDLQAGKNKADFGNAAGVITKYFPNAQQSMTFISVDNLFGPEQLIEVNAIAVTTSLGAKQ